MMLTKLISHLPIQLEKVLLVKKTEIKPDKITIYLEEVRGRPQGTAHSIVATEILCMENFAV